MAGRVQAAGSMVLDRAIVRRIRRDGMRVRAIEIERDDVGRQETDGRFDPRLVNIDAECHEDGPAAGGPTAHPAS